MSLMFLIFQSYFDVKYWNKEKFLITSQVTQYWLLPILVPFIECNYYIKSRMIAVDWKGLNKSQFVSSCQIKLLLKRYSFDFNI